MFWKTENLPFGKQEKTFLEQIGPLLRLGNIYSTSLFTLNNDSALPLLLLSLPLQIIYLACCLNISEIPSIFNLTTKFEHAADVLFFTVTIICTITRTIYFFANRKEHKKIVLDVHRMNLSLGKEKRQRFVPNAPLTSTVFVTTIISSVYMMLFVKFQMVNPGLGNIVFLIVSFQSNLVNNYTDRTIGEELRQIFKDLNDKFKNCIVDTQDDIMRNVRLVMQCTNIHDELVKFSLEFAHFCYVPILITLTLNITFTVWLMHACIMSAVLKMPYYQYIVLMGLGRVIMTLIYIRVVEDTFGLVGKEVRYL